MQPQAIINSGVESRLMTTPINASINVNAKGTSLLCRYDVNRISIVVV